VALPGRNPTKALEALIVLALRGDLATEFGLPLPDGAASLLTPKGQRALDSLGPRRGGPRQVGRGVPKAPPAQAGP
jgi:hypothetical protein